jgi:hypothetical protein
VGCQCVQPHSHSLYSLILHGSHAHVSNCTRHPQHTWAPPTYNYMVLAAGAVHKRNKSSRHAMSETLSARNHLLSEKQPRECMHCAAYRLPAARKLHGHSFRTHSESIQSFTLQGTSLKTAVACNHRHAHRSLLRSNCQHAPK